MIDVSEGTDGAGRHFGTTPPLTLPDSLEREGVEAPVPGAPRRRGALAAGIALASVGLLIRAEPYLTHRRMFSHDNLPLVSYLRLSYGNLMAGRLPLWTPELNAGQPLWPVAEVALGLDPVAGLAWLVAMASGGSTIDVLHWACIGWLLAFAAGAVVLARRLTDDPLILMGIYAYLVLGPIWLAMPTQSYGFLLPFRYLPWVLWLLIRLVERPTRLGGLGLGIVGGLSLAGYQTLYALPLVVIFTTAYGLARVRRGLRLHRTHAWAALSALLAFLPIALPTVVALFYASTDLYVVARTHYQGRYAFPLGAFVLDLVAPLTASPRSWHGAFSLGPGPLFLLLLGVGALLLRGGLTWTGRPSASEPDEAPREARRRTPERAALSAAWLATTVAAVVLAVGPATDRLFLGLRNWGFVLTLALLGTTQLTAAAADLGRRWLEDPNASARRALSLGAALVGFSAVGVLGFHLGLRASADVARECVLRLVCDQHGNLTGAYVAEITLGLAPFVAVLVLASISPHKGVGSKSGMSLSSVVFLGLVAWHLVVTLHAGPLGGQSLAIPAAGGISPRAPGLDMAPPALAAARERVFDIRPYVPFHYEGPAVWHHAAARTLPVAFAYGPLSYPVTPITHVFRFWRYQVLVSAGLDPAIEDRILAVSTPPLRLATRVFRAGTLREALDLLARPETTETGAVVVEANPLDLSALARPVVNERRDGEGTVQVERFSGDAIALRVGTPRPALLVYSDGYDPDWSAFVDGRPVPVYPANVIGKAVPVPPGDSQVRLVYRPWLYLVGFWLRALTLLVGGGAVVGLLVYRLGLRRRA